MRTLADYQITEKWPPTRPRDLQLYSLGTPNGVKIPIALEEIGLAYEAHTVSFETRDQHSPAFLSLNPNNKIPAIIDPDGPGGAPLALWESGAILLYLADKTGRLTPADAAKRWETVQWVFFQVGAVGPMFGQVGYFNIFAGAEIEDKRPLERYVGEARRLLGVLDARLDDRAWMMGDEYTIADIAIFPWIANLIGYYKARDLVEFDQYANVARTLAAFLNRPAVQRGMAVYP
jgi:GST-like protein